jgi:hypothetical protein
LLGGTLLNAKRDVMRVVKEKKVFNGADLSVFSMR